MSFNFDICRAKNISVETVSAVGELLRAAMIFELHKEIKQMSVKPILAVSRNTYFEIRQYLESHFIDTFRRVVKTRPGKNGREVECLDLIVLILEIDPGK